MRIFGTVHHHQIDGQDGYIEDEENIYEKMILLKVFLLKVCFSPNMSMIFPLFDNNAEVLSCTSCFSVSETDNKSIDLHVQRTFNQSNICGDYIDSVSGRCLFIELLNKVLLNSS